MPDDRDPQTYAIIGAAMEVHKEKGCGFAEPVYQECLEIELELRNIPFQREYRVNLEYKGRPLRKNYRADFVCFGEVLLELKACTALLPEHIAQTINYLRATGLKRALLLNFGKERLEYKRIVLDYDA
ncbi:MAG: GxxExxY protein [Candidatus Hydrogenedentes bacterium]|nr:GxxExxY protein [Candidatus Hydrogenedentota bacterium]